MINTQITYGENYFMEGFEVSIPQDLLIEVSSGKFFTIQKTTKEQTVEKELEDGSITQVTEMIEVEEISSDEYSPFSFKIESDDFFNVTYDVYLLELPTNNEYQIHIDRTEMDGDTVPFYSGKETIRFLLMSFIVPPNTQSLDDVQINVKRVVRNGDYDPAEQ
ncbi:hypothetical protein COJ01_17070 [Priestia megaterium]|uniref:hypothetical protein n=1 Tax=Priestia megaterium TaxID=1404 RepID=UPI000BFA8B70|nr:hypothetical protein [Priestia megaterium]PFK99783.1 hypothetical protein COJ01_17070 [Priestia megaterium]